MTGGAFAIDIAGATLVGERAGPSGGVPLVLVHGFGGTWNDWDRTIAALPANTAIIAYDQRGFGQSQATSDAPFSHAEDLLALLDALEIAQADVCGMSLGGATVLGCALIAPTRVRKRVLVSPMLAGWSWSTDWIEQWKAIGRAARSGDIATARSLWWQHPLFASVRDTPAGAELQQAIAAFPGRQWIADFQRDELPMVERLGDLSPPTLLLTGARDVPDFRLMADLIAGAAPRVKRIDFPDAGHMLTLECPTVVAAAISGFVSEP